MLVYQDILSGDELLADTYPHTEILNGILWEVEGKWLETGAGKNPSAEIEGGEEYELLDEALKEKKAVDIVGAFGLQKLPPFTQSQFRVHMKTLGTRLYRKLDEEKRQILQNSIEAATNYLAKLSNLELYVGEGMDEDGLPVFAYNKEGAANPTFVYFAVGLKSFEVDLSRPNKEVEAPAPSDPVLSWGRLHFLYL